MLVRKASGEKEEFSREKIIKTCVRAGASRKLAESIARSVEKKAYEGISTRKILKMTIGLLEKQMPHIAAKYDLKGAIMRLGPAGYSFERLVAEILSEYGYSTKVHQIAMGACVKHELDVVIKKNSMNGFIECKYHNAPGIYTGIKDLLYTYARFLDLKEGGRIPLNEVWLCSNTKFSRDAITYARCKAIRLLGWAWPRERSLEIMIEKKKLYPITVLRKLDRQTQQRFARAGLMLVKDLIRHDPESLHKLTGISIRKLKQLRSEAERILK